MIDVLVCAAACAVPCILLHRCNRQEQGKQEQQDAVTTNQTPEAVRHAAFEIAESGMVQELSKAMQDKRRADKLLSSAVAGIPILFGDAETAIETTSDPDTIRILQANADTYNARICDIIENLHFLLMRCNAITAARGAGSHEKATEKLNTGEYMESGGKAVRGDD